MKFITVAIFVSLLTGCVNLPAPRPLEVQRSYIDKTVSVPKLMFMETPESKSVLVGSSVFAQAAGCQYMQRYKVRTTSTFTDSLNLLKYRSAMMGAKRLTIVKHEEIDSTEGRITISDDEVVYLQTGTSLEGASFHTTIIADLYDCMTPN